jgi:hypothetical protein
MVFGQLLTAGYNMIEFQLSKELVKEIIFCFAKQNQLNEQFMSLLEQTIESKI